MAGRRQDLETRIVAKDDASKVIDKVADQLDDLEKKDTTIDLTADDQASDDIRTLSQRLDALSDEDKVIVLKARVTDAERDVDKLLLSLRNVDKLSDEEVQIRVTALGDARAELDQVQDELRQLDGETATVHVDAPGLDSLTDSLGNLPGMFGEIGEAAAGLGKGGGIVAGVAAIAGGLGAAANSAADLAIEAKTLSELTGDTVEDSSKLQSLWKSTGADAADLADIILQINGVLASSPELAGQLGINLADGATGGQRFLEVIQKIDDFTGSAQDKAVLMSQLLGEEGARQGAKLLAVVEDIGAEFDAMEAPVNDADVAQATEMKAAVAEMNRQFQEISLEIGQEIIPLLTDAVALANSLHIPDTFGAGLRQTGGGFEGLGGKWEQSKRSLDALMTRDVKGYLGDIVPLTEQAARAEEARASAADDLVDARDDEIARLGIATSRLTAYNEVQGEIAADFIEAAESAAEFLVEAERVQDVLSTMDKVAIRVDAFATAWDEAADTTAGAKTNLADLVEANQALIDGFRDSEGKIRLARTELDVMSESGRDNIAAAEALRDAYGQDLARALEDTGGNYRKVRERARFWREELEGQLEALGLSETAIDDYVTALGLTPEQVTTTINLSKQEEAMAQLDALNVELDDIDDRAVQAEIVTAIEMGDYVAARDAVVAYYDDNPATLPVKPVIVYGGYSYITGAGANLPPSGGTLAAPTAFGAPAGVTPMAGPTLPTLMLPVSAPAQQQQQPIVIYQNIQAAVIGAPHDVMLAVEDANRRLVRLMPTRP